MEKINAGLIVVGGGCGGFATALRAARDNENLTVILVEKNNIIGGTATIGGVNCWEPGISGESGLHRELADRLIARHNAAGTGRTTHFYNPAEPWSMSKTSPDYDYKLSMRRAGLDISLLHRFHFEPYVMAYEMENMLRDAGITIYYNTILTDVNANNDRIDSIICSAPNGLIEFSGDYFADCTGDIVLPRMAECDNTIGQESYDEYFEQGAPEKPSMVINGATLVFRVTPSPKCIDPLPAWVKNTGADKWLERSRQKGCSINEYPNLDLNMNILPVLEGMEYWCEDKKWCQEEAFARILVYWNYYQREKSFDHYTLNYIFPAIGVRESHRLIGRYVLTSNDIVKTYKYQNKNNTIIAFSDHPIDVHGSSSHGIKELEYPYGVPYESLLPKEYDNMIVACRGASFTHIAAASCRLSRSMLACGEAAGAATALAFEAKIGYGNISIDKLRACLKIDDTISWIEKTYKY